MLLVLHAELDVRVPQQALMSEKRSANVQVRLLQA